MKRAQRRFHANVWPIIALIMLAVVAVAIVAREHPSPSANVEVR